MLEACSCNFGVVALPDITQFLPGAESRDLVDRAQVLLEQWYLLEKEIMPGAPRSLAVNPNYTGPNIVPIIESYEKWAKGLGINPDPRTTRERLLKELSVYDLVREEMPGTKTASVAAIVPEIKLPSPPTPKSFEFTWPMALGAISAAVVIWAIAK